MTSMTGCTVSSLFMFAIEAYISPARHHRKAMAFIRRCGVACQACYIKPCGDWGDSIILKQNDLHTERRWRFRSSRSTASASRRMDLEEKGAMPTD